ncbi:integral membrane protein [Streptomyces clavuligerus]|nr:integral membrane protein [Streptomyces clavuligerus]
MLAVVAVVVLLIAAIAFVNRGDGTGDDSADSPKSRPGAAATAASGVTPVKGRTEGVPTGYARDEQGAQSAAANYTAALGSDGMYDSERRGRIVDTVYTRGAARERRAALDKVYGEELFAEVGLRPDGTAPPGQTFVSRFTPLGSKVERYSDSAATVSVWYTALFGMAGETSKNPVTQSWYTYTFQLKWASGDWKVADYAQKDGPVPVGRDQTASGAKEMADAVQQFGGYTYAR